MARVTEAEVRAVITTGLPSLTPFIDVATLLVDEELDGQPCMTDARLTAVELWLSAHLTAMADGRQAGALKRFTAEGITKELAVSAVSGEGLRSTRYGATAIMLDCTGILANMGKARPSIESIGSI